MEILKKSASLHQWNYKHLKLKYQKCNEDCEILCGYVDADWGSDVQERKSTSGYVFKVFNCTVSWTCRKQSVVALSSSEAEHVALTTCVCEGVWLKNLLCEMSVLPKCKPFVVFEDNRGAIFLSKNPGDFKRSKHIDIKYHFIRDKVNEGIVNILYCPSSEQIADIFTKSLSRKNFCKFRNMLGLL